MAVLRSRASGGYITVDDTQVEELVAIGWIKEDATPAAPAKKAAPRTRKPVE